MLMWMWAMTWCKDLVVLCEDAYGYICATKNQDTIVPLKERIQKKKKLLAASFALRSAICDLREFCTKRT
jgi:hypothetical protein